MACGCLMATTGCIAVMLLRGADASNSRMMALQDELEEVVKPNTPEPQVTAQTQNLVMTADSPQCAFSQAGVEHHDASTFTCDAKVANSSPAVVLESGKEEDIEDQVTGRIAPIAETNEIAPEDQFFKGESPGEHNPEKRGISRQPSVFTILAGIAALVAVARHLWTSFRDLLCLAEVSSALAVQQEAMSRLRHCEGGNR
mmetsp:Transcript_19201/g.37728  ORF Transcript_19201/g.37728 Transcript_19201/m.37728 type:complete len:200 (+) Transcript_19201:50-649(+)